MRRLAYLLVATALARVPLYSCQTRAQVGTPAARTPASRTAAAAAPPAQVNARIVDAYNRRDTVALQALWAVEPNKAWLTEFLGHLRAETGAVTATHEVARYPGGGQFVWRGERKNLRFDFYTDGRTVVEDWSLNDFTLQSSPTRGDPARGAPAAGTVPGRASARAVATDNLLRTPADRQVHERALLYLADTATVGLSIGVLKDGRQYVYNYGEIKRGSGQLPTPRTFYELGSITKTFATTLLAKAATEGRVRLTDDIRRYLPGASHGVYPNLEYQGQPIRLVHLANHTSGLPFWTVTRPDSLDRLTPYRQHLFYETYTMRDLARDLRGVTLRAAPGTTYEYSGAGINTLILVLERVYGRDFERLVREYFGAHYGMRDTKKVLDSAEVARTVTGYDERGMAVPYFAQYTGALGPELYSTTADMLAYLAAHLSGDPALALAQRPTGPGPRPTERIGLGWMLGRDWYREPTVYHTGGGFGGHSAAYLYPARGLGVVVLVNEKRSQNRVGALVTSLADVFR
jgi:CubicO group peptidase (beta-lactamase class C family)